MIAHKVLFSAMILAALVNVAPLALAQTLTTLVSFDGVNGANPYASLVQATDGNLYGTTQSGGTNSSYGTVFKLPPEGMLITLYSFCQNPPNCTDGADPYTGLVQGSDGNFYGTTYQGGGNNGFDLGTVFKVTPEGMLSTLYSFCPQGFPNCPDGVLPEAGLVQGSDGNFYGTASDGGDRDNRDECYYGCGTVFKITPGGVLTTLYKFCSEPNCTDGGYPAAGLVQGSDGNFYGTTEGLGANGHGGTVFKITPGGALTTLYSFCSLPNCADGQAPSAVLVQATDGNLYGTTNAGGDNDSCEEGAGCGTVFKITSGGALATLYSFCSEPNCTDGANPVAGVVEGSDGNFYGTTPFGGGNNNQTYCYNEGCGSIFKITPSRTLTTLYSFCRQTNCTDGVRPYAGLVQATDRKFYGTTDLGGTSNEGTVFSLSLVGNGIDISRSAGDVSDNTWQSLNAQGIQFVIVQAWGGRTQSLCAKDQLVGDDGLMDGCTNDPSGTRGAQNNGFKTAAYVLLNYDNINQTGTYQVNQGLAAVGSGLPGLKFMVLDVEPINGELLPLSQFKTRIARMRDAVDAVRTAGLRPVIYTDRTSWMVITGNCNASPNPQGTSCPDLIALPLWDVEHRHYEPGHCGDGIIGLVPFTPYPSMFGWQMRQGNQYDYADPSSGCNGTMLFGIPVDLDFFNPTLFR